MIKWKIQLNKIECMMYIDELIQVFFLISNCFCVFTADLLGGMSPLEYAESHLSIDLLGVEDINLSDSE